MVESIAQLCRAPIRAAREGRAIVWCTVAIWAIGVLAVSGALVRYSYGVGDRGAPVDAWPASVSISRATDAWTVVMFAHPHCPCTRASVSELARLQTDCRTRCELIVVIYCAPDEGDAWSDGAVRDGVARIPGAGIVLDPAGALAQAFGVVTSGHVLAYDPDGRLAFSGGITPGRGHEGLTAARMALERLLEGGRLEDAPDTITADVFGCPIYGEADIAHCARECPS